MNFRIKITLETERLLVLRGHVKKRTWCKSCKMEADFVPSEEVNGFSLKLNEKNENECLHKFYAPDGTTLICLTSLLKSRTQKND